MLLDDDKQTQAVKEKSISWVRLDNGKQFSRLLYTNPLCLLQASTKLSVADPKDDHMKGMVVVVLSRLTTTNNTGSFMFCLSPSEAQKLLVIDNHSSNNNKISFTLSVPVHGMEDLLQALVADNAHLDDDILEDTVVGTKDNYNGNVWKGIKGCVAHLRCRVCSSQPHEHCTIVFAQVSEALVDSDYWDDAKNRFVAKAGCTPYLKRLGKDMFGYVLSTYSE